MVNPPGLGGVIIGKRLAMVKFSPQFLLSISIAGPVMHVCMEGVPSDAKIVSIGVDKADGCYVIVLEHPSFPMQRPDGLSEIKVNFNHYTPQEPAIQQQLVIDASNVFDENHPELVPVPMRKENGSRTE